MKRTTLLALAALPLLAQAQLPTTVVDSNIRYCESTLPYRDGVLIANFGTEQLNPLNSEGKGYILYFDGKTTKTVIPADGHLNAPKGMYLDGDDFLFIADVNKVVVYDLNTPTQPQTLQMPEGDLFVNDMAAADGTLYISVTNTDRIYSVDLNTAESHLKEWASVPGPNGIVIKDGAMYVASYPADGTTKADNVIYRIADLKNPQPEAYINIADDNAEIRECLDEARRLDLRQMVLAQFDNIVVSNTDDYLNIRESPDDGSIDNICGKFPSHAGGELLETTQSEDGRTWYKIKSGPVTGYVSADYCATGESARNLALEGATLTAMVNTDALNVRSEPSTEASVWTQIAKGQEYHVLDQLDGWVEIELDASDGTDEADRAYVSTRDNNVEVRYGLPEAIEYYPAVEAANAAAAFRNEIVNYACQFVGNPYVWGGTSLTNGADCSGFVMKVLEHFGISVPRVSRDQARAGVRVTSANMKPGDLVFYANSSGTVNHVGMYIGNGQVVNAASRRSGIRIYAWNYRTPVAIRNVIGP